MSLLCVATASEENCGRRVGKCRVIVDHAVRGREELGGNDRGRCNNGDDVELDGILSRGSFWWIGNNVRR